MATFRALCENYLINLIVLTIQGESKNITIRPHLVDKLIFLHNVLIGVEAKKVHNSSDRPKLDSPTRRPRIMLLLIYARIL